MTNNKKMYDLPCLDSRRSFYGKAKVIEENGEKMLLSYNTIVCKIDANGHFVRLWGGESMTTTRHIDSFCAFFNVDRDEWGVRFWRAQPVCA